MRKRTQLSKGDRIRYYFYKHKEFQRHEWRAIQIGLAGIAYGLTNLLPISTEEMKPYLLGSAIFLLGANLFLEKERLERRGNGPTGFQYLSALFTGQKRWGYEDISFFDWFKIVGQAAHHYFPPYNRKYENNMYGACNFRQFVRFMANGPGNNPEDYQIALNKALTM